MRILISSNGPHTKTGYGTQTKGLMNTLLSLGHDVAVFCWYGLQGGIIQAGDVRLYPRLKHPYGDDVAVVARHFKADLVITLQDIWVLSDSFKRGAPCPWAPWFPIDGEPLPPPIAARLDMADYPIVFSEFAGRVMEDAGNRYSYIPHGIDTETFSPGDKEQVRRKIGVPDDAHLVSMVAANKGYPSRKSFPEAMQAFKQFHDRHPKSHLYLHMEIEPRGDGLDMKDLIRLVDLPQDSFRFVDQADYLMGLPDSYLADVYRASDLLLAPSMGEGFGLPIAEAQAAGCPVIVQDATSMSELCVNGVAVPPLQRFYTPLGHWQYVADVDGIANAMEWWLLQDEQYKAEHAAAGIQNIRDNYAWDICGERYWKPFLQMVQDSEAEKLERANGQRSALEAVPV